MTVNQSSLAPSPNAINQHADEQYELPSCAAFLAEHADNQAIDYYLARDLCLSASTVTDTLFYTMVRLSQSLRGGHSCLQLAYTSGQSLRLIDSEDETPNAETRNLKPFPEVSVWRNMLNTTGLLDHPNSLIVLEKDRLYIRRYWRFEQDLASRLRHFINSASHYHAADVKSVVDKLFPIQHDAAETDWQKVAVINSVYQQLGIIAGGPGTGKTTTVTKLLLALLALNRQQQNEVKIKLVAPTGKAAQRLQESITEKKQEFLKSGLADPEVLSLIPATASTLHRLLGYIPNHYQFRHHEDNLLDLDILVVDEASMIDLPMMTRLFRALPDHAHVILLGDADQLPSVETGSVLAELVSRPHPGYSHNRCELIQSIDGGNVRQTPQVSELTQAVSSDHVTLLQESYRFRADGGIGNLAKAIIKGDAYGSWNILEEKNAELGLHKVAEATGAGAAELDQTEFLNWLLQHHLPLYRDYLKADTVAKALTIFARFRILTATRVGPMGVTELNTQIEQMLWKNKLIQLPAKKNLQRTASHYHGRPVMVTENDYASGLYNGDIGMIWRRETAEESFDNQPATVQARLQAAFFNSDGGIKWVSLARLPKVESVFAMTIHKTQGSEFDQVALVLPAKPGRLLSRELIYTAVTRAKTKLDVFSRQHVWRFAVEQTVTRYAGLREKVLVEPEAHQSA
ncbi:MAG: exodeoxyribonuclease V subunit alpha [Hahellaceae bacterium]|nr:exodeoxyribonuclease V subunit alpha [Hahellaceae bacterium]